MGDIAADLPKTRTLLAPRLRTFGDDRLGRLAAAGDERAFAVVYERHHQALYRYCRSILGDHEDAADALQSTMAAALRGLKGETREIRLKPWLFRIAHNECIALLRTRQPQVAIDESLELVAPEGADRERLQQLVADLRELSEAQRSALVLRELNGLGHDEIAAVLGTTPAGARQTVFEARNALHEFAEGRAMECESVRQALSDNDGRVLRGRKLRAHVRSCASCRDFRDLIGTRKRDLAMIAPPIPAAVAAGVLHHLVAGGAATATGGGAGAGAGGAGLGSLAAGKAVAASTAFKAAAIVAATAAVGVGTVETVHQVEHAGASKATKAAPPLHQSQPAGASGHVTVNSSSHGSATATAHSRRTATKQHGSRATTHKSVPSAKSHSHSGKTHRHHAGGNSNGAGQSGGHKTTPKHEHPQHPTTPTGKGDTPGAGKGRPTTKGPSATSPGDGKKTPTVTTPTLPPQTQDGAGLSDSERGASGRSKGITDGLTKN